MPKPIFIVRFPKETIGGQDAVYHRSKMIELMPDYHVLLVPTEGAEYKFECYNSENVNDVDFELLQKRVFELIKS